MATPQTLYDVVLTRLKGYSISFNVTRYTVTVGDVNTTTGVPAVSYGAGDTIEMLLISKAAAQFLLGTGLYVKTDAMGLTKVAVQEGERIKDANDVYYMVTSCTPFPVGDVIVYYQAELTYLDPELTDL